MSKRFGEYICRAKRLDFIRKQAESKQKYHPTLADKSNFDIFMCFIGSYGVCYDNKNISQMWNTADVAYNLNLTNASIFSPLEIVDCERDAASSAWNFVWHPSPNKNNATPPKYGILPL